MHFFSFSPHSLKTRIILINLLVMLGLFLALGFYAKRLMRQELMLFTGVQQRSALALLTTQVNNGLQDRLDSLALTAGAVTPALMDNAPFVQAFLGRQRLSSIYFNAGLKVWSPSLGWVGQAVSDAAESAAPGISAQVLDGLLKDGQLVVGDIQVDDQQVSNLTLLVPIRDTQGAVVGGLAGVMRLDAGHFLTELTSHPYGKSGHYFLVDRRQRIIFATSDPVRRLEILPAPGVNPQIDRFYQGFEGTTEAVNPHGLAVLVSVQQIPQARWYASVTLPQQESSALIEVVAPRIRLFALGLAVLCVVLIFLMLRRQLAPMTTAVRTLDGFVRQNQAPQALQVVRDDEVGQLVGGFNRLLDTLNQQQRVLQQSELFKQAVLNSVTAEIAVLDHTGVILAVNEAWQRGVTERTPHNRPPAVVGSNYLSLCEDAAACEGIRAVLGGQLPQFHLDYACHTPQQQRWCSISVTSLDGADLRSAVVSIADITERTQMQEQVRALAFYDPLTRLPNRRLVLDRLTQEVVRARRLQHRLALLFIDLDEFKPVNDERGHAVGDWLLTCVAQRIQGCLRESDTAARLGGDEFVVLLPHLQSDEAALGVAEKIRLEIAREFVTPQGVSLRISSSIGVALYPDHALIEHDLMRLGDEAMYLAKKTGRNSVVMAPSHLT